MNARPTGFSVADAKARFSELLARAEAGEEIVIRRHGKEIAKLVAVRSKPQLTLEEKRKKHEEYLAWRRDHGPRLPPGVTVRDLIEEGRKY